jgi:hypothetical protein
LLRVIEAWLREGSRCPSGRLAAVSFVQRFGSTLNAHVHFHRCVIDGVLSARHLERLAALTRPLRQHRHRCHAVRAPTAPRRASAVHAV